MPKQIELKVLVNLDPMPGAFSDEESARYFVQHILMQSIPHYNPMVLSSLDIAKEEAAVSTICSNDPRTQNPNFGNSSPCILDKEHTLYHRDNAGGTWST